MSTEDMVQKSCTASSNCTYRFMGSCGFGCGYDGYCDYQLPRDSRGQICEQPNPEPLKKDE